MTRQEVIEKVKSIGLPRGSYVVFGGAPLAIYGIREAKDIDLLVSKEIYAKLEGSGWKKLQKGPGDNPLTSGIFEAHDNWNFSPYSPTLEHLLSSATIVDGIPFASLEEVRKWKMASGRAFDLIDIELIGKYLGK